MSARSRSHNDFRVRCKEPQLREISPKPGEVLRISLLHNFYEPERSYCHTYGGDSYVCNTQFGHDEAPCCKLERLSSAIVFLGLVYLNADDHGSIDADAPIKYRLGCVSLDWRGLVKYCRTTSGYDLLYSNDDGGCRLRGISPNPVWKHSPQAAEVEAAARELASHRALAPMLGKKLTNAEWDGLLKGTRRTQTNKEKN